MNYYLFPIISHNNEVETMGLSQNNIIYIIYEIA